ncbi:MAG: extracellular solute-binding protein [Sphaerochaeta sp.]|nr:extracellular solute-binding protein [Sphaerochaeta sp.]
MKGRKILALLLIVFLSLSAAYASGAKESQDTKVETIDFWHHYSAQSAENKTLMNVLIPRFQQENPGIKVNAVSHEWAELHNKVLISSSTGSLPDVARCDIAWLPEFQKMGILVPLDSEVPDFEKVSSRLLESAMSTTFIDKNHYALALNTNTKILFYNTKMLKDANVAVPKTTDELVAAIRSLSGKNAKGQQTWGWNEPALSGWNLCPFIWTFGGALTNADQTVATGFVNGKETVQAIETFVTLVKEGGITGFNSGDIPMTDGFGTYRYAMMLEGPWKTAELDGSYPNVEYGTALMPTGKGGSVSVLGGEDIAMLKGANKDAAWKFMTFMTGEFAQIEMAKSGQIPVNKMALASDTVKNAPFAPFLDAIKTARARPTVSTWSEIDNELNGAVHQVISGKKTVRSALDELAVKMDALLK